MLLLMKLLELITGTAARVGAHGRSRIGRKMAGEEEKAKGFVDTTRIVATRQERFWCCQKRFRVHHVTFVIQYLRYFLRQLLQLDHFDLHGDGWADGGWRHDSGDQEGNRGTEGIIAHY